jgi:hypothetical protein
MKYKDFKKNILIDLIKTQYQMKYKKVMNEIDLKLINKLNIDNLEVLWKEGLK